MRRTPLFPLLVLAALLATCGGDAGPEEDRCMAEALPLTGDAEGPTVTHVGLEVQPGEGIVVVAPALAGSRSARAFPDNGRRGARRRAPRTHPLPPS